MSYIVLKKRHHFFNNHYVQRVIAKFGKEKDKEKLHAYEKGFKNFCKRNVFEVPKAVFGPPPDCSQMLAFKVTDQIIESLPHTDDHGLPINHHTVIKSARTLQISLNDALKVQMRVAELFGVDNGCLVFLGASKGCIELKFSARNSVLERVRGT